jgi:hypothetical protein
MHEFGADFYVVAAMRPGNRIFSLPDLIVEALASHGVSEVRQSGIAVVDGQQTVEPRRVTIPNANGVAELPDVGIPARAVIQSDMAPAETGIVGKIAQR